MSRFANYLRNLLPCNDAVVMEMAAKAMGVLALSSGTFAAEYVEFEVRRALEWLATDKSEGRRHAAVSCQSKGGFLLLQLVYLCLWEINYWERECLCVRVFWLSQSLEVTGKWKRTLFFKQRRKKKKFKSYLLHFILKDFYMPWCNLHGWWTVKSQLSICDTFMHTCMYAHLPHCYC